MPSLKSLILAALRTWRHSWDSRRRRIYNQDLSFSAVVDTFKTADEVHAYMHHFYHHLLKRELRQHRQFFRQNLRGFGEDAFHAMWWVLLREFQPKKCLEIGVYRGQVVSLWALIGRLLPLQMSIHGISPFLPLGDGVSAYRADVSYLNDTLVSFKHWSLPAPILIKALSTDTAAQEHVAQGNWDLIYIDGGHDFETALADYQLCFRYLRPGGLLVLDDASLGGEFHPPRYSFAGHPGPSRVAREYASQQMQFLGAVGHNNVFRKL